MPQSARRPSGRSRTSPAHRNVRRPRRSTALIEQAGPRRSARDDRLYHRWVADTISRFDGFVAKYMGDGVLVYFGYPQAHEDDAERAVRAGLALIQAVGSLGNATVETLQVRIGIATGPVIVGDLIGRGEAQERGVVGENPNLAARCRRLPSRTPW